MSTIHAIDGHSNVSFVVDDDLTVLSNGQVFNQASIDGGSTAALTSKDGAIHLLAKIDGQSSVQLTAAGDVQIDGKIDGQSTVTIVAGGTITISDKIDGQSVVKWKGAGFTVKGGVNGGSMAAPL